MQGTAAPHQDNTLLVFIIILLVILLLGYMVSPNDKDESSSEKLCKYESSAIRHEECVDRVNSYYDDGAQQEQTYPY